MRDPWKKNRDTIRFLYREVLKNNAKIIKVVYYPAGSWNIHGKSKNKSWIINLMDINVVGKNNV